MDMSYRERLKRKLYRPRHNKKVTQAKSSKQSKKSKKTSDDDSCLLADDGFFFIRALGDILIGADSVLTSLYSEYERYDTSRTAARNECQTELQHRIQSSMVVFMLLKQQVYYANASISLDKLEEILQRDMH